jgi:hypothetical protein
MMKNVYGDQCMSHTRWYEWFKRFKGSQQSTHEEVCLGWPWMSCDDAHVAQVCEIMRSNHHLTVREIAEECNISCHDIPITKLEMHRVVSKFVPWLLTQDQRDSHVAICQELLYFASEDENFLKRIITGDETSVLWIRCGNENGVFTMSQKKFAETKKGAVVQVEHESHVDGFVWRGCCASWILTSGQQWIAGIISKCWNI